ncbi:hypothetical protein B23_0707 [Geobacillus thermoleovorans B23]|nr:hypothetical protein B23_0707 [Geobacillus thermoleovorans B23]
MGERFILHPLDAPCLGRGMIIVVRSRNTLQ